MTPLMMYFWLTLDSISAALALLLLISVILAIAAAISVAVTSERSFEGEIKANDLAKKVFKNAVITFAILLPIHIAVPTTKQAAIIFGVPYLIDKAAETQIPVKVVDYLNAYIDNEIKTLKEKSK